MQSIGIMQSHWAEENLQTIRILMERSAVYRRALAPIMLITGGIGTAATVVGLAGHFDSVIKFCAFWLCVALVSVAGALLVVRRQAGKDGESFWSPPTRRVSQALLPPLFGGMVIGLICMVTGRGDPIYLPSLWALFYGCALHSAGFFMQRGMKWFGWIFILGSCLSAYISLTFGQEMHGLAHWLMGVLFGGLHLFYGGYLYLTEKKNPVA